MSCWRSWSISSSNRCRAVVVHEVVLLQVAGPGPPGRAGACRAPSGARCATSSVISWRRGSPELGAASSSRSLDALAFSCSTISRELLGDVVVDAAEVVALELSRRAAPQLLEHLAHALEPLAVAVPEALLHHPAQRRVEVAVVEQVVGHLVEQRVGVEIEAPTCVPSQREYRKPLVASRRRRTSRHRYRFRPARIPRLGGPTGPAARTRAGRSAGTQSASCADPLVLATAAALCLVGVAGCSGARTPTRRPRSCRDPPSRSARPRATRQQDPDRKLPASRSQMVAQIAEHAPEGRVRTDAQTFLDALKRRQAGDTSVVDNSEDQATRRQRQPPRRQGLRLLQQQPSGI